MSFGHNTKRNKVHTSDRRLQGVFDKARREMAAEGQQIKIGPTATYSTGSFSDITFPSDEVKAKFTAIVHRMMEK